MVLLGIRLLYSALIGCMGLLALMAVVCPVPDPKLRMEGPSKLKIDRKEASTQVTRDPI